MTQNVWVPVEVGGGYWMLAHQRYQMLVDDLGWFASQEAAEAKARELHQLLGGVRRTITHGFDPVFLN